MRRLFGLAFLLIPLPTYTQNVGASDSTLTPSEIKEGYLLLFDGESLFGWTSDGAVSVEDGGLVIKSTPKKGATARFAGRFRDFELQFEYLAQGDHCEFLVRDIKASMAVPVSSLPGEGVWRKMKVTVEAGQWKSTSSIRDDLKVSGHLQSIVRNGLEWSVASGSILKLKNIKLHPLGMKSIFNGKDLAGWKEFPGKKSKFAVTSTGEINVKDGPGDLQTEGKYENFLLQLECISNGKHLNSGVFFRCRPDEYQNGYEAQIRNQFTDAPSQEYVIEEYDPITHKLAAKKKEKFTAVDYGTGAIYRRYPARKEVAKDGAWFTFTILADRNHLMTWVNGIAVVDWTDHRPPSDNARNGNRLEAGHISLQGHDPTTDLSFRNFRIAELK